MNEARQLILSLCIWVFSAALLHAGGLPGDWAEAAVCRAGEGNLEFESVWDGSSPVRIGFRLENPKREFLLSLAPEGTDFFTVPPIGLELRKWQALRRTGWNPGRKIVPRMPVMLKFREEHWLFYLQNRLVACVPSPGAGSVRIFMPPEQVRKIRSRCRFYLVPRVQYSTDFMIEEGAGSELYPWLPVRGKWGLHTALAEALKRPETNQGMTKQRPLTADKSPNFYSLKGTGSRSVIATGYDFYDGFSYAAAVQAGKGEGGLVFYLRGAEKNFSCYGWTIEHAGDDARPGRLHLWCLENGRRRNLLSYGLALFQHQWYRLSVRLVRDSIQGYLDGVKIADYRGAVPPGGRIGLYADCEGEYRFDDILLESTEQMELETVEDLSAEILSKTAGFRLTNAEDGRAVLEGTADRREECLLLGRRHQRGGFFSVSATPVGRNWNLGICGGCRGKAQPFYRLELSRQPLGDEVRLCMVENGRKRVLESLKMALPSGKFSLQMDASQPEILRFFCNGRLLFLLRNQALFTGACGIWLGEGSRASFDHLELLRKRPEFVEQRQKNPVFRKDSFMRHWASPEGQWIGDVKKRIWHKGDFLGDFTLQMPWIDGSRLHLCVAEGQTDGKVQIGIRKQQLELSVKEPEDTLPVVLKAEVPPKTDLGKLNYRICHEGYLFWVEAAGKVLLSHRLRQPLKRLGTRVRVERVSISQLARSQAYRKNVIDEFFYESPYAWQQNGGEWLIINRFQCTPSWSHMIGQNNGGLAALWRKQIFKGDMTLEFYAGTRHEHYSQAGNLNCTIFADQASPSRGYTATVTEWDQNLSQNWSRLYRNGRMLAQSDLYMVPRNRNGHYRRILNPLISGGRPIHGAWFYIKVRKLGNKLEYYFDDELIYTVHDKEEVLQEGLVGIWTFIHSMTLAQIKITFEQVRPRPVETWPLPEPSRETAGGGGVFQGKIGGMEVDSLRMDQWRTSGNGVGSCRILPAGGRTSGIRFENQLGGGDMRLMPVKPQALPLDRLAGWEFNLRLENQAQINVLYDIVGKGTRQCYQQLNAGNFTRGKVHWMGKTEIGSQASSPQGQKIRIWIPHRIRKKYSGGSWKVVFRGFGSEQQDFQECGIYGNPPGAAYEIRDFHPVFYGVPDMQFGGEYRFHDRKPGEIRFSTVARMASELVEGWKQEEIPGVNIRELLVRRNHLKNGVIDRVELLEEKVAWIHLPEKIGYRLSPHPAYPATLMLQGGQEFPDPRLPFVQLWQGDSQLQFAWENGRIPPDFRLGQHCALVAVPFRRDRVEIALKYQKKIVGRHSFAEEDRFLPTPPVLTDVRGFTPFFYRGINEKKTPVQTSLSTRNYIDGETGLDSQMFSQTSPYSRLKVGFKHQFRMAQYPVMQIEYRADDMANVSLAFGQRNIRLTRQDADGCAVVRNGTDWILDGKWHSWTGIYADGLDGRYERYRFDLRSVNSRSQTGRYSWLCLDRVLCGPAVRENAQLYFTPVYGAGSPVKTVRWRLAGQPLPDDLMVEKYWRTAADGAEIRPDASSLQDGLNWLCFYGVDERGRKSSVCVWPFLLDRQKLSVSVSIVPTKNVKYNGSLMRFSLNNHHGSPWDYSRARVMFGKRRLSLPSADNCYVHRPRTDALELNYPRLFRKELNGCGDGDVLKIQLKDIYDGAGNHAADCTGEHKVNYAGDKVSAQWFSLKPDGHCLIGWNWIGYDPRGRFSGVHNSHTGVVHLENGNHCLVSYAYYGRNFCRAGVDWDPFRYDRLSFRAMFPAYRNGMKVLIQFATNRKRTLSLSLQKPSSGSNHLNRTETFVWKSGEWQNFSLPVKQWLEALKLPDGERKNFRITSVEFCIHGTRHGEQFRLDDFYIHDSGSREKAFSWETFDASGTKGVECIAEKTEKRKEVRKLFAPDQKITFGDFDKEAPEAQWLRLEPVDKAGNRTPAVWIPLR